MVEKILIKKQFSLKNGMKMPAVGLLNARIASVVCRPNMVRLLTL